jgi:hypothetical protein
MRSALPGLLLVAACAAAAASGAGAWLAARALGPLRDWRAGTAATDESAPGDGLAEANARLAAENIELRRRLREHESLDGDPRLGDGATLPLRARVVARTSQDGRRFLELDHGAIDGIAVGDPVLGGDTLVGVVRGVQAATSLVQAVDDQEFRMVVGVLPPGSLRGAAVRLYAARYPAPAATTSVVAGSLQPAVTGGDPLLELLASPAATGPTPLQFLAEGVYAGAGAADWARLLHVEDRPGLELPLGAVAVTAGLDALVPAGLPLGTLVEVRPPEQGDHWRIRLRPWRDHAGISSVLVLRRPATTPAR